MPVKNPPHPGGFVLRQCIEPLGVTIKRAKPGTMGFDSGRVAIDWRTL